MLKDSQSSKNSIENIIDPELEKRREDFHFPKNINFDDPIFSKEVFELYGKHHFDWEVLGRKEKKRVRNNYRSKCKEYFIEQYNWPPFVAKATSKLVGLHGRIIQETPEKIREKTPDFVMDAIIGSEYERFISVMTKEYTNAIIKLKKISNITLDFAVDAIAGSLPQKYTEAIAHLKNEPRENLTKKSIIFDAAEIGFVGGATALLYMGYETSLLDKFYESIGIGHEILKFWMISATAFRTLEVGVRTLAYQKNKTHTPSPAILFPFNPTIIRGGTMSIIFAFDVGRRIKDVYREAKENHSPSNERKIPEIPEITIHKDHLYPSMDSDNLDYLKKTGSI